MGVDLQELREAVLKLVKEGLTAKRVDFEHVRWVQSDQPGCERLSIYPVYYLDVLLEPLAEDAEGGGTELFDFVEYAVDAATKTFRKTMDSICDGKSVAFKPENPPREEP